jgi:hypothetical protein
MVAPVEPNNEFIPGEEMVLKATAESRDASKPITCVQFTRKVHTAQTYVDIGSPVCSKTSGYYTLHVQAGSVGTYDLKAKAYTGPSDNRVLAGESAPVAIIIKAEPTATPAPTEPPAPTTEPQPTNTLTPGNVAFNFKLLLHGIGKAGDNVTPGRGGNTTPAHPQRTIKFEIYDGSNQKVADKEGTVQFNSTDGNFTGKIDGGTLAAGSYSLRVWSSKYLWRRVQGIQVSGSNEPSVQASLVVGDSNNDNKLNILDYNLLLDCYSDLSDPKNCSDQTKKDMTDLTDDGKVNLFDLNLFLRELSNQDGD